MQTNAHAGRRSSRDQGGNQGKGNHWIRDTTRERLYARDGWRCTWCGCRVARPSRGVELGSAQPACLDHIVPREQGGTNAHYNLVTACMGCNSARQHREPLGWLLETMGEDVLSAAWARLQATLEAAE